MKFWFFALLLGAARVYAGTPIIPNIVSPIAAILINPNTGLPYKSGGSDVAAPAVPIGNSSSPTGVVLINPTTGVPYH